jgi:hypothetical protein
MRYFLILEGTIMPVYSASTAVPHATNLDRPTHRRAGHTCGTEIFFVTVNPQAAGGKCLMREGILWRQLSN